MILVSVFFITLVCAYPIFGQTMLFAEQDMRDSLLYYNSFDSPPYSSKSLSEGKSNGKISSGDGIAGKAFVLNESFWIRSPTFNMSRGRTFSLWFCYHYQGNSDFYGSIIQGRGMNSKGKSNFIRILSRFMKSSAQQYKICGMIQQYYLENTPDITHIFEWNFDKVYPPNIWHHAAVCTGESGAVFYLNGKKVSEQRHVNRLRSDARLEQIFFGDKGMIIDEIAIFDQIIPESRLVKYVEEIQSYLKYKSLINQ